MGIIPALTLYTVWVCLSCAWAINTQAALYAASMQVVCLGLVCAVGNVRVSVVQRAVAISGSIVAMYGISQWLGYDIVSISWDGNVPVSTIGNPNFLAAFLILCIPPTLAYTRQNFLYASLVFIQVTALIVTGCKGAWIGLCVGLLAFEKRMVWLSCLIAIPLLFILVQPDAVKKHLYFGNSIYGRISLWENTTAMIKDYPVLGTGPGNYFIHFPKYMYSTGELSPLVNDTVTPRKPHNWLLQVWAETGAIGLILFINFIVAVFRLYPKSRHKWLYAGILAMLVHGLFTFPQDLASSRMLFYLFIGLLASNLRGKMGEIWVKENQ